MRISGSIGINDKGSVAGIQKDEEDGKIHVIFDDAGSELELNFEPECFEALLKEIKTFKESGDTFDSMRPSRKSKMNVDITVSLDEDKKLLMESDIEAMPHLVVFSIGHNGEKLELCFSKAQAEKIGEHIGKIGQIGRLEKEVQKKITIAEPAGR
jgi:hypothetical protein